MILIMKSAALLARRAPAGKRNRLLTIMKSALSARQPPLD